MLLVWSQYKLTQKNSQRNQIIITSTNNNGDSVIKEDTAILIDEEPTLDDLVENSIADTPFEKFTADKLLKSRWGPYYIPMFQLSSLHTSASANKDKMSDKGGYSRSGWNDHL